MEETEDLMDHTTTKINNHNIEEASFKSKNVKWSIGEGPKN